MPDVFYISPKAYSHLIKLSVLAGFVKTSTRNTRGMSAFLNELADMEFSDTRPTNVKELHQQIIRNQRMPEWSLGIEHKVPRSLDLTQDAHYLYVDIALHHKIFITQRLLFGKQSKSTTLSIISKVLEAIGCGYLTPAHLPTYVKPQHPLSSKVDIEIQVNNPYYAYTKRGTINE